MFLSRQRRDSRVMARFIREHEVMLLGMPQAPSDFDPDAFYARKRVSDTITGLKDIAQQMGLNPSVRPSRSERHLASFFAWYSFGIRPLMAEQMAQAPIGRQRLVCLNLAQHYLDDLRPPSIGDLLDSDPELMSA